MKIIYFTAVLLLSCKSYVQRVASDKVVIGYRSDICHYRLFIRYFVISVI